jgi:hypothetical protein
MASFCLERSGQLYSEWDQGIAFFSVRADWLGSIATSCVLLVVFRRSLLISYVFVLPSPPSASTPHFPQADDIWLQPPGWVHKMIHETWQPLSAMAFLSGVDLDPTNAESKPGSSSAAGAPPAPAPPAPTNTCPGALCTETVSAAYAPGDAGTLVVRYANPTNSTFAVSIRPPLVGPEHTSANDGVDAGGTAGGTMASRTVGNGRWVPVQLMQLSDSDLDGANPANDTMHISPTNSTFTDDNGGFSAPGYSFSVATFTWQPAN